MADDGERLVVLLKARLRDFERNMNKAAGTADKSYGRMTRGSRSAARQMEADMARSTSRINQMLASTSMQIGALGRTFVTGFAGGVFAGGIAGLARGVRGLVSELSNMGKEIDRVGLSAKAFQELKFGFGEAGVSASEFTTGMEQFTKRIGEAATSGGRLAEIFKANGIALRDQAGNIRSNDALLRDYANLIKNATSEQEKMVLATEAFGRGGASFVNALKGGADAIDDMADAAAEAGGVIDEELIRKAEELDDRWAASWRKFEINAKSAILNVLTYLDGIETKLGEIGNADFFKWMVGEMDSAGMIDHTMLAGLEGDIARAEEELANLERQLTRLQQTVEKNTELGFDNTEANAGIAETERLIAALERRIASLNGEAARGYTLGTPGDPNALAGAAAGAASRAVSKPAAKTIIPGGKDDDDSGGRRSRSRNAAADAALREAEAVANLIDNLSHELSLIGQTDLEKAKSNALRQAGSVATDKQKAKIEGLIEAIHREAEAHKVAQEAAESRAQAFENVFQMASDGLLSVMDGSVKAEDAVKKLAIQLALAAIQAALLGSGPFAGILGGLGGGISGGSGASWIGARTVTAAANPVSMASIPASIPQLRVPANLSSVPSFNHVPAANRGAPSSAQSAPSVVRVELSKDLEARILSQAEGQSLEIVRGYDRDVLPARVSQVASDMRAR